MTKRELFTVAVETEVELISVVSLALFEAGAAGVEEQQRGAAHVVLAYTETESEAEDWARAIDRLREEIEGRRKGRVLLVVRVERTESDWATKWTAHLGPVRVTDHIVVVPHQPGTNTPVADSRTIRVIPTMAFGFGSHPTTRMCARRVARRVQSRKGIRLLDVGTGTGVLAFVAAHSGAEDVWGLEVDPVALESAQQNARLNGLAERCHFRIAHPDELEGGFDVVVANIDSGTLIRLAGSLARQLVPGGVAILGGIPDHAQAEVTGAYRDAGLDVVRVDVDEGWVLLEAVR